MDVSCCTISTWRWFIHFLELYQSLIIFLSDGRGTFFFVFHGEKDASCPALQVELRRKKHLSTSRSSLSTLPWKHFKYPRKDRILLYAIEFCTLQWSLPFLCNWVPLFQLNNLNCLGLLTVNLLYQTDVMILYISNAEWCMMVSRVRLPLQRMFVDNFLSDVEYL